MKKREEFTNLATTKSIISRITRRKNPFFTLYKVSSYQSLLLKSFQSGRLEEPMKLLRLLRRPKEMGKGTRISMAYSVYTIHPLHPLHPYARKKEGEKRRRFLLSWCGRLYSAQRDFPEIFLHFFLVCVEGSSSSIERMQS